MKKWLRSKKKAVWAAAAFAVALANAVGPDNKYAALAIAIGGVLGVHQATNTPIEGD